jgi:hypothetical protein
MTPEAKARHTIDALQQQAGWLMCYQAHTSSHATTGVIEARKADG